VLGTLPSTQKPGCQPTLPSVSLIGSQSAARRICWRVTFNRTLQTFAMLPMNSNGTPRQRIAHLDREVPTTIPTFDDLNRALDVFERLVKRYRLLLRADGGDVVPVVVEPWETVLEVPWIPPRL
jgi:hypothetical protein